MATHYFILEDGTYKSISGREWYRLLKKQKFYPQEARRYFVHLASFEKGEDDCYIETSKEKYDRWEKDSRKEEYQKYIKKTFHRDVMSYDFFGNDESGIPGGETIEDQTTNVEETAVEHMEMQELRQLIAKLDEGEQCVLYELYLSDNPISERELSRRMGVSQKTLNYRKKKILEKLKKLWLNGAISGAIEK
ncbi:MAG: hypothetical protein ACLU8W_07765 [Clostridia bacterium]